MHIAWIAAGTGMASALLALGARRAPPLAWLALAPLGIALSMCGGWAALTGAFFGALLHGSVTLTQPAKLRPLGFVFGAIGWGLSSGAVGLLLDALQRPSFAPLALALALPLVAFFATLPMRLGGAPRWIHAALACTQESSPVVIRTGWIGGDVTITTLLALSGAAVCMLAPGRTWSPGIAVIVLAVVFATVASSAFSIARTQRRLRRARRVRIAAVVVNGEPPKDAPADGLWPISSPEYRDVEATIARYEPHVLSAARQRAEVIVLPEVAVSAEGVDVERWLAAVTRWARELDVTVVAPHFDPKTPTNTLTLVEPSGSRWTHDKQHPAPGLEPAPRERQPPGPYRLERGWALSAVICVDLDYPDLIAPVRASGGVLVVPANDWLGFAEIHDQSAVWAAVLTGTTVLRATGHGICSARDGAGTLLARASSLDGPTVLVVDVPLASPE